jgi:hypothetical protein
MKQQDTNQYISVDVWQVKLCGMVQLNLHDYDLPWMSGKKIKGNNSLEMEKEHR